MERIPADFSDSILTLQGPALSEEESDLLAVALGQDTTIHQLTLDLQFHMPALTSALTAARALKELCITPSALLTCTDFESLSIGLRCAIALESLKIDSQSLDDGALCILSRGIEGNRTLTALSLSSDRALSFTGLSHLARALTPPSLPSKSTHRETERGSRVQALSLRLKLMGSFPAEEWRTMLLQNRCLTSLTLDSMPMPTEALSAISEGLERNCSVISLALRAAYISDRGAHFLIQSLKQKYPSLTALDLSDNSIGDSTCSLLPPLLYGTAEKSTVRASLSPVAQLSSLTALDLSFNRKITDRGAQALAHALQSASSPSPSSLVSLNLARTSISDSGAIALAQALESNNVLTHLSLRSTNVDQAGGQALAQALSSNKALLFLDLGCTSAASLSTVSHCFEEALNCNESLLNLLLSPLYRSNRDRIDALIEKNRRRQIINCGEPTEERNELFVSTNS